MENYRAMEAIYWIVFLAQCWWMIAHIVDLTHYMEYKPY